MIVRGARQVGKTSFVINALEALGGHHQIKINLASSGRTRIEGVEYFGRDFFGAAEDASQLFHNISLTLGDIDALPSPAILFIDEADRYPIALEAIQAVAGRADKVKAIYTGSNLENISVRNAATGRKRSFDLYPITFSEFLAAYGRERELAWLRQISLKDKMYSEMFHNELTRLYDCYLRIGGMPRLVDTFLTGGGRGEDIPRIVTDLVASIEENIKAVLGEHSALYEYVDVLRKIALLSFDTLKFSRLQVQHVRRSEAVKLVAKTVGARVVHKIRLFDAESDLSKYIIFDPGVLNYLLNGSDLLRIRIADGHLAIQHETSVGDALAAVLPSREDLFYWKSKRGAQVEFLLRAPRMAAIDVKSTRGDVRSLDSCAVYEETVERLVKVSGQMPSFDASHVARIPNQGLSRSVPLMTIPHYLSGRIPELVGEV